MVIDTSALVALLFNEPEAGSAAKILSKTSPLFLSSFTLLETQIVVAARKGGQGSLQLEQLLQTIQPETVPLSPEHTEIAMEAWQRFGKGRHPAGLNIGDCCAYALAVFLDQPLLFKGNDFGQTDVNGIHV